MRFKAHSHKTPIPQTQNPKTINQVLTPIDGPEMCDKTCLALLAYKTL